MPGLLRLACLLCVIAAPPAMAQAPTALDCTGPFARDAAERDVARAFGAANVERAAIDVGEAMTEPGTLVFAGDRTKRIEILWRDKTTYARPSAVILRNGSTWRVALAGTPDAGVAIGATLAEVEAMNGKPFTIAGFGWDLGGFAGGWHGGRLDRPVGGCSLALRFDPATNAPGEALDKVNGDVEFESSNAYIQATKPVVIEMILGWPQ